MAKKTLQDYVKYYKKNHPEWSDAEVNRSAQLAFDLQPGNNPSAQTGDNPVIGRKPTPTPTPTATPQPTVAPGLATSIAQAAANTRLNIKTPTNVDVDRVNFVSSLTKAQMKQIIPWLDKFGASKTDISTMDNAKKFLESKFPTYVENSKGSLSKLIQLFKDDYIPSADPDAAAGPKSNGVTQYVTKQSKALVAENVDKFLMKAIGSRNVNEDSRKKIMDEIQKMIDEGTTTTTKRDKAGKTTVTQTPGYSEERAGAVVERVAKEAEPIKYEQQKQLNFFDFMQQAEQMRGGR